MVTIARQIKRIRAELASRPPGLLAHIERVVEEAKELGAIYDVDPERVELAAVGHDLFRAFTPAKLIELAGEVGLAVSTEEQRAPVLLHGPIAAVVLAERFRISDEDALEAVRDHTAGLAEMPLLAKIILLADKFEPRKRKRTPIMQEIRKLARRDLDVALMCWADWKWVDERLHGYEAYPVHWNARVHWVREHHVDVGLPARTEDDWDEELLRGALTRLPIE